MRTLIALVLAASATFASAQSVQRLSARDYRDRMKAGWIGQMAGVGWGAPTEFKAKARLFPESALPKWEPKMINQFNQDDLYVEMTFLRTLEVHGLTVSIAQAGIDFANSGYPLWHANEAGRKNLRAGIAPPDSGHPAFNKHADDIDYQIEADFAGLISPGLPNQSIALGEKFGRLVNYGDGVYGGQFVAAMYSAAFFENDLRRIVESGLAVIPAQSQYAQCIRDTLAAHDAHPDDFAAAWNQIHQKYQLNPDYRKASCDKRDYNIDAKVNGAYIVFGLLYGKGDPDKTIQFAIRCGQDSDCNPSNAAGILFTTIGFAKLPAKFTSALDERAVFDHTQYSFPRLLEVCDALARQSILAAGGRIEKDSATSEEVFIIPVQAPRPSAMEQCWAPTPAANARYSAEQMKQITAAPRK